MKVKLSQSLVNISTDINFLINAAIASTRVKKLMIDEKYGSHSLRPSLHVILSAPVGQAKSTVLQEIAKIVKKSVITEVTRAGLVGTLDQKTCQFIPGAAWECRNSLLLLDEFSFGRKKDGWEVFLQLLENQSWGKRVGIFTSDQTLADGDLHYKVEKGRIDLKTRFSCVIATMKKFELQRGQMFRAFVTRCVPYHFDIDEAGLANIAENKKVFSYKDFKPRSEVTIRHKMYIKILKLVKDILSETENEHIRKELYLRSVGDCCRVYAVLGKTDMKLFKKIVRWKLQTQLQIGRYFPSDFKVKQQEGVKLIGGGFKW